MEKINNFLKWLSASGWNKFIGVVISLMILFLIPIGINVAFFIGWKKGIEPNTVYSANDLLGYYGIILTFCGTIFLGSITLWQNKRFKEANDQSEEKLNNAVKKLAEANEIIAAENRELVRLEKENQRIQLLLAQDYIPFLEVVKFENGGCGEVQKPEGELFSVQGREPQINVSYAGRSGLKKIEFDITVHKITTMEHYYMIKNTLSLLATSKAKLDVVNIEYIRLFNNDNGNLNSCNLVRSELDKNNFPDAKFLSSDLGIFYFSIIVSDDYKWLPHLEILLQVITTTGVSFWELVKVFDFKNTSNQKVVYALNGEKPS